MDELELIQRSKEGNKQAFNELLKNNYSILMGYVIKLTIDQSLAQDIVQETLLKAVVNIDRFEPRSRFSTWLITIATNTYRDYLRKNKNLVELNDNLPYITDIEDEAINRIQYENALSILATMPYDKRVTFILKHYYGYKYEEIAKIMNCPIGTVRSRLNNSIKILLSKFDEREETKK